MPFVQADKVIQNAHADHDLGSIAQGFFPFFGRGPFCRRQICSATRARFSFSKRSCGWRSSQTKSGPGSRRRRSKRVAPLESPVGDLGGSGIGRKHSRTPAPSLKEPFWFVRTGKAFKNALKASLGGEAAMGSSLKWPSANAATSRKSHNQSWRRDLVFQEAFLRCRYELCSYGVSKARPFAQGERAHLAAVVGADRAEGEEGQFSACSQGGRQIVHTLMPLWQMEHTKS